MGKLESHDSIMKLSTFTNGVDLLSSIHSTNRVGDQTDGLLKAVWPGLYLRRERRCGTSPARTHINKSYFYDLKRATCDEDRNEAMS